MIKLKGNNELVLNKDIENSTINGMKGSFGEEFDFIIWKSKVGHCKNHFNRNESDLVDEKENWRTGTGLEILWTEEYQKEKILH